MRRLFLAEYVKNFRTVGAVTPSSRFLARKMVERIDFDTARVIVEYGPGTGVFTRELAERMHPDAVLVTVEHNDAFCEQLRRKYEGNAAIIVAHDSAENIQNILRQHAITQPVDYVVSGLPFAALPQSVSHAIMSATKDIVATHGVFVTFQYTLLKKQFLRQFFERIDVGWEYRNVPPAYVMWCDNTHVSK